MATTSRGHDRVVFAGLNELRALAALAVLVSHVELYKHRDGHESLYKGPASYLISHLGKNGVYLFFVLSGFLITYLLLTEQRRTGTIRLGAFYARRALRIWPVYYVVVALGFAIIPTFGGASWFAEEHHYVRLLAELVHGPNLALHLAFLSNLALVIFPAVVGASQSWSVSVEEQFYAIWPLLLRLGARRPWLILLGVIVGKLASQRLLAFVNYRCFGGHQLALSLAVRVLEEMRFELMAIGGLAAWLLFARSAWVERWAADRRSLFVVGVAIALQLVAFSQPLLLGTTFAILVIQVVTQRLRVPLLARLGTISYGVYMYHPLAMFLCFGTLHHYGIREGLGMEVSAYAGIGLLTVSLSAASYHFLERPFLTLKERFAVVPSGAAEASSERQTTRL